MAIISSGIESTSLVKGRLGYLLGPQSEDLIFQFNPQEIERERAATYAKNQAAYADFPNSSQGAIPSREWIRNEDEEFNVELFFHYKDDSIPGTSDKNYKFDVDLRLGKLDEFMKPDPNTGRPKDLILVLGQRTDRVRILTKRASERMFDEQLRVLSARVTLRLFALRSRSA